MGKAWILGFLAILGAGSAYMESELMEPGFSNSTEVLLGKRSAYSGMATWYDVETWKAGACGQDIDNSMHIVALNEPMYGSLNERSSWCGKKIMIANGLKTAKAVIMDACPQTKQCHHGALDMSMSLFQEFHHLVLGVFPITWVTSDDDDDHPSHPPEKTSSHSHHDNSTRSRSDSSSSHSSTPSSSSSSSSSTSTSTFSSSSSFASSSSSYPTSSSQSDGNAASRSSERSAASASAASARARAASIAKKQSLSKASARSASSTSQEMAASCHASSHGSQTRATTSSPPSSSSSGGRTPHQDTSTSTSTSNDDDPRAGNLENFGKVLNGLSMLVHAAAHDEQE